MRTLGWKILIAVSINRDEMLLYTIAVLYSLSVLHLGMGEHAMERRRVMLQEEIVVEQLVEANIFRPHEQKRPVLHPRQGLWVMVLVRTGTVHLVLEGRNETLCPGEGMIRRAGYHLCRSVGKQRKSRTAGGGIHLLFCPAEPFGGYLLCVGDGGLAVGG